MHRENDALKYTMVTVCPDWSFLKVFGNKQSYESSPNIWWLFGLFWKTGVTIFGPLFGKIELLFISTIGLTMCVYADLVLLPICVKVNHDVLLKSHLGSNASHRFCPEQKISGCASIAAYLILFKILSVNVNSDSLDRKRTSFNASSGRLLSELQSLSSHFCLSLRIEPWYAPLINTF